MKQHLLIYIWFAGWLLFFSPPVSGQSGIAKDTAPHLIQHPAGSGHHATDSIAPQTAPALKGEHIDNYIISPHTRIILTAHDAHPGVDQTRYYIDDQHEHPYHEMVNISSLVDGEHTIHYYSVDKHKNREKVSSYTFYLDKIAPIVATELLGDRFISEGKVFFSGRTKLKITAMDNKSGVKAIFYAINGGAFQRYEKPFYIPHRTGLHYVDYYAVDHLDNRTTGRYERQVHSMYMDLTGPVLSHSYTGTRIAGQQKIFISPQTKVRLSAHDPESGLQRISYRINGQEEKPYDEPFVLETPGEHTIEYVGFDNVKNLNRKSFTVVVDVTGPEIFTHFSVPASEEKQAPPAAAFGSAPPASQPALRVFPRHTLVFLAATDAESGTEKILYSLNSAPEQVYRGAIGGFLEGKLYTLKIRATDKLGNQRMDEIRFMIEK